MIDEGDHVPDFELPGTAGDGITTYRLSEFTADGPALLSFYSFDFSPTCEDQLCGLRDTEWFALTDGMSVTAVSGDGPFSHRRFAAELDIDFPLLADTDGGLADRFGVLIDEFEGCRNVPRRSAFIIDDAQTVQFAWRADDCAAEPDLEAIREAARGV